MKYFLALLAGGLAAGVAVYFAAQRTRQDLLGTSTTMQAAFEAAGRQTQSQMQAQADAFARRLAVVGQEKIQAAAMSTAQDVVTREYGITPQLVTDLRKLNDLYQRARSNPFETALRLL